MRNSSNNINSGVGFNQEGAAEAGSASIMSSGDEGHDYMDGYATAGPGHRFSGSNRGSYGSGFMSAPEGGNPHIYHLEDEYQEDLETFVANAPSRIVQRQREQATMFGMPKWKSQVRKKALEERSPAVRDILEGHDIHPDFEFIEKVEAEHKSEGYGSSSSPAFFSRSNIAYTLLFGWMIALGYLLLAGIMFCTIIGIPYGKHAFKMAKYHFWPFGKYVCQRAGQERLSRVEEDTNLLGGREADSDIADYGEGSVVGHWLYVVFSCIFVAPFHGFAIGLCWFFVVFIPMAKLNMEALRWNFRAHEIDVVQGYPGAGRDVLICTYKAANLYYMKYTVGGMNIMLVNLLPFVFISLFIGYLLEPLMHVSGSPDFQAPNMVKLLISLFSIIPLTYYIGTAISSISAQTDSFAAGAVLNATFGSICELIIYCSAIARKLPDLVQAGVTGSLLGVMLLLPGLAMLLGGIKYKEQRFSRSAAGVSSVLLLLSIVAAFLPTLFFINFGAHSLSCGGCTESVASESVGLGTDETDTESVGTASSFYGNCGYCYTRRVDMVYDPLYDKAEHISFASAFLMPIAYCVGLWFTLKTHTHIYDIEGDDEEKGGHDAPEWSRSKCVIILLVCTILFAALSEELLGALDPILDEYGIPESFAGLTIIAVVPNTAEIVNAIQFSMQGNFALSLEIGSSAAVQIALIQIPILFLFSVALHGSNPDCGSFTLVFPAMDMLAVIFSTLILTFIAFEGKSNYFTGSVLLIVYTLFVVTFWFIGAQQNLEAETGFSMIQEFAERKLNYHGDNC